MRVIVTGGAGFIGSHLCERLLKDGHEVICIDSFISGSSRNIQPFRTNPAFQLIEHDVTVPLTEELGDIHQIYHLACPASPVDYKEIPLQTLWTSAAGTKLMLELANKKNSSLLLASTSEVYGDPQEHPQKETYWGNVNPIGERSCYTEGKRFAESLAINYYKHYRFPLKIVRIFNTYGPKMRKHDGRVIPNFINAAMMDEPLRICGDGSQTRSFCYIDDMVEGLISAMNLQEFIGPVNIGNDQEITIMELAKKIVELTGSSSMISQIPLPQDDPRQRKPDLTLALEKLKFNATIGLEEGLRRTIEYLKN
jgi:UDP-glucuronate decarboxylase